MISGLILYTIAKAVFVVVCYLIQMYLGKALPAAEYGVIGVFMSIININYNFLNNGASQALSRTLATHKYDRRDLIRKGVFVQSIVAVVLAALNFFGAPLLARLLNAPEMTGYIQLTAILIPFTAGYFIFVGGLNGMKLFVMETSVVTLYPLLRLTTIPFVEWVFEDSTFGTIAGFLSPLRARSWWAASCWGGCIIKHQNRICRVPGCVIS